MKRVITTFAIFATTLIFAQSSSNQPKLSHCFPAGAPKGTTIEVELYGQKANKATPLINDKDIKIELVYDKFVRGSSTEKEQRQALSKMLRETKVGDTLSSEVKEQLPDLMDLYKFKHSDEKLTKSDLSRAKYKYRFERQRNKPNADFANGIRIRLTIPETVKPGKKEIRLKNYSGVSKPVYFFVSEKSEVNEIEPLHENQIQKIKPYDLPICINGEIFPGDFDIFKFNVNKNQKVSLKVQAREIKPFLADGVPGWFEAMLTVRDPNGKLVKYADCDGFEPDPRSSFQAKEAGVYSVELRDSIYRGRDDFVYRLIIENYKKPELKKFDSYIDKPGIVRSHPFKAKKDQSFEIRTVARTLKSPIDTFLQICDEDGKILASNDDMKVQHRIGLQTVFPDSQIIFKAPHEGTFIARVSDTTQNGGKEFGYNIQINPLKPRFDVYIDQSNMQVISGFGTAINFKVDRYNTFDEPIIIKVKDKKSKFWLEGAKVPADANQVSAVLYASNELKAGNQNLEFIAYPESQKEFQKDVIPTDAFQQAFLWLHHVPTENFQVRNLNARSGIPYLTLVNDKPLKLEKGKESTVEYKTSDPTFDHSTFNFYLLKAPKGVTIKSQKFENRRLKITLIAEEEIKYSGNIIIDKVVTKNFTKDGKKRTNRRPAGTLPPIAYTKLIKN